jgi:hypothetical protein
MFIKLTTKGGASLEQSVHFSTTFIFLHLDIFNVSLKKQFHLKKSSQFNPLRINRNICRKLRYFCGLFYEQYCDCHDERKSNATVRLCHPLNSLVVTRNLWLILLSQIWYCSNIHQKISKILRIPNRCLFFL